MGNKVDGAAIDRAAALLRAVREGNLAPHCELAFRRLVDMVLLSEACRVIDDAETGLRLGYATWPAIRDRLVEKGLIRIIPSAGDDPPMIAVPLVDESFRAIPEGPS